MPSLSVEVSVKLAAISVVLKLKPAVGTVLAAVTVTFWVRLSVAPSSSVTVRITL